MGKPGTVMWVCEEHAEIVQQWNDKLILEDDVVRASADLYERTNKDWPQPDTDLDG